MDDILKGAWWMLVLRGVAAVLFGLFALIWPGLTLILLIAMFAGYAIVGGVVSIVAAIQHRGNRDNWWVPLLFGIVSVAAGVIALLMPGITLLVLVAVMGANAIVTGIFDIIAAVRLQRRHRSAWMLFIIGALSIVFGIAVMVFPVAGALALVWMVSAYALITGALLLALGIRARGWLRESPVGRPRTA